MANLEKINDLISSYESNLVVLRKLFMTDGVIDREEQEQIDQVEALLAKVRLQVDTSLIASIKSESIDTSTLQRELQFTSDPEKKWNFDTFLEERKKVVHVMSGEETGAGMSDLEEPMDREDKENPTATFHLLGYDIVRQINLLNASGKVIETIKIEKGHLQSGGFSVGESVPVGKYLVEIKGTHIPIVRGRAWYEGAEELDETVSINKIYKDQVIHVLIDFKQEFSESPYYPPKQDNVAGKETSVSLQPPFGIKTINLIRTNSANPIQSWSIDPSKFEDQITVPLSDENEFGKYPDDRYAFEIIGYNKGEVWESSYSEKIDELRLTFKWRVESPPVSVTMNIDFDPRTIYFIKDDGTEEPSVIPGERPYMEEVFFVTPNLLTKNLLPGKYKIKISGIGENQQPKTIYSDKVYIKKGPYSRFVVLIRISDKDLRDEIDKGAVTAHLIQLATNWWAEAVRLINARIEDRYKNKPKDLKGLIGWLKETVLGSIAKAFAGECAEIVEICEESVIYVVQKIIDYAQEKSLQGSPTVEEILRRTEEFITSAKVQYTITGIDKNEWFQQEYLRDHKSLTTKKMLLQITEDIDWIVARKSMSQLVQEITSKK
jgi:hypothetical protein